MKDETLAIHAGYEKDKFGSMTVPIYQTTAYDFGTAQSGADRFALKELAPIYTRLSNPTTDIFEARLAAYEKGVAALSTSSGQAAVFFTIANLASAGDNIIVSQKVYGGTTNLLTRTISNLGIEARVFDSDEAEDLEEKIDKNTKAIFFESLSNPQIAVANIEKIVQIANKYSIVSICDNTVATPVLFKPIEWGVDVVVHSTSKYISGQGLCIGGALIERENLKDKICNNPRYRHFDEPDPSYHGLVYKDLPYPIFTLRARLTLMRDFGSTPSPFNSWLLIQGLETLAVRVRQHSKNAKKIAKFLSKHPKVKSVSYPGLKSDSRYEKAKKYFKNAMSSGLLSFETIDEQTAIKVQDKTKIFSIVTNIGDTKSIITHSASTTHKQVPVEDLKKAGVSKELLRLSVGLEDVEDLIEDLRQALED